MTLEPTKYDGQITDGASEYNLIYAESSPAQTELLPLQAQRIDTGSVGEIRPESGFFFSQNDFSGGQGQARYHAPTSDRSLWLYAEGIALKDNSIVLQHSIGSRALAANAPHRMARIGDSLFVTDGTAVKKTSDPSSVALSSEDPHDGEGAVNVLDIVAVGDIAYAACGANDVHLRSAGGTWSHYVTTGSGAAVLGWVKERLMVVALDASGDASQIYEIDPSGPTANLIDTLPAGWNGKDIVEVGGYIHIAAYQNESGKAAIYTYGLTSAGTALERKLTTRLSPGDQAHAITEIGGIVLIAGSRAVLGGATTSFIDVGVADATGAITWARLAEGETTSSGYSAAAGLWNGYAAVGWSLAAADTYQLATSGRQGIALYNPATGAFVPHLYDTLASPGDIRGVLSFKDRLCFTSPAKLYYEETTKRASGSLITSVADFNNAGMKLWDEIRITHKPLPAGSSIQVYYSTKHPDENSWTSAGTSDTENAEGKTFDLSNVKSRILALKFVLSRATDTTLGPELINYTVRAFPCAEQTSDIEWRFARDVRIIKGDRKPHNRPDHSTTGPWGGDTHARRKALQDLAYKKVTLTEPDATWSVRVVGIADVEPMQPITTSTEKDEGYIVRMTFEGRRTA